MNTTLVFAELIVVGVEGMLVFIFMFLALFGVEPVKNLLEFFKGWEIGIYFIFLSLIYVVGVLLDRFADNYFDNMEKKILHDTVGGLSKDTEDFVVIRYSLGKQNEYLNQQLEYTRTKVRIARSSALLFPIIAVFASVFIYFQLPSIGAQLQHRYILSILFIGVMSYFAGKYAWGILQKRHLDLAKKMYLYEKKNGKEKKKTKNKRKPVRKSA